MKDSVFLDTNVLLRHFLQDHLVHSPKATAFLRRVEQGEVRVVLSETVLFETAFGLERRHGQTKAQIRADLLALLDLPAIRIPGKGRLREVFDLYVDRNIPFADAHHAVIMRRLGLSQIASFDRHFDRIPGITRVPL